MTTKRTRFFSLFGAILFLITASSLTIAVVISIIQSNNQSSSSKKVTTSIKKTTTSPKTTTPSSSTKLQGTKLSNFTPTNNIPKLSYIDTIPGTGAVVSPNSTVTVNYTGAVAATGIIFQSSLDTGQPATFGLNQVIAGWQQGIPGMKVGGTRRLFIPASLAYGSNPPQGSGIPANANLVFDVTVLKAN